MKRKKVGRVYIGPHICAHVYVNDLGDACTGESPYGYNRDYWMIDIGVRCHEVQAMSGLLHELNELAMTSLEVAWRPLTQWCSSTQRRLFVLTHQQFEEASHRASDAFAAIWPKVKKARLEMKRAEALKPKKRKRKGKK